MFVLNTACLLYLYKAGHRPTDFLNCANTTEGRIQNLIMIIMFYTMAWYHSLLAMYIPLMIDYINLWLT